MQKKEWRLSTSLALQLTLVTLVILALAGGSLLLIRLPQISQDNQAEVEAQAYAMANRIEFQLSELETRLSLVARLADHMPAQTLAHALSQTIDHGKQIQTIYIINRQGIVEAADSIRPNAGRDLKGLDFSASPLFQMLGKEQRPIWSDKYLSVNSGTNVIGIAIPAGERSLIAEIPLEYLLRATRMSSGNPNMSVWVIDQRGEVVADTGNQLTAGVDNILKQAVIEAAIRHHPLPGTFEFMGKDYYPAAAHASSIGWLFLAKMPAGLDNSTIRDLITVILTLLAGTLLATLVFAPIWAQRMTRKLQQLMLHARKLASNQITPEWPRSSTQELNLLAADLERMSHNLSERERKATAFFNASATAMMVIDTQQDARIIESNIAWCRTFGWERKQILGQAATQLGLWKTIEQAQTDLERLQEQKNTQEIWLQNRTGQPLHCRISASPLWQDGRQLLVLTMEDITAQRALEGALQDINSELEQRVEERTRALQSSNRELRSALDSLQLARNELVRSEKLSALGELVAGIAHELNTPIGNALMASSTLRDHTLQLQAQIAEGLRRSDLENYTDNAQQAGDIISRNLERAANLVGSFKQVAVDQTSSQRRTFDLSVLVNEILLTLQPTLKRTPFVIQNQITASIQLDSYPGPLGQALSNLINNAILHGFDEREHGHIIISAQPLADTDQIRLIVSDDGKGIPPEIQKRIFTPFFTTRLGRGGTGLGLHIVQNVLSHVLGGTITVASEVGKGSQFILNLPRTAPVIAKDA